MNKKLLVSLGVVSLILLSGGVVFAEELDEAIKAYLQDPSLDFLGHEFEKILFQNLNEGNNLFNELKFIIDDIKTMPLQAMAYHKIFTNKINILAYGSLSGVWGLKAGLGAKEFNKVIFKIIKLALK